jgi:hypothetical protein
LAGLIEKVSIVSDQELLFREIEKKLELQSVAMDIDCLCLELANNEICGDFLGWYYSEVSFISCSTVETFIISVIFLMQEQELSRQRKRQQTSIFST